MLEGTVRHHQAILMVKILFILCRMFDCLLHQCGVFRMNPPDNKFYGGRCGPVVLEDSKSFLRPSDYGGGRFPAEAASVAQALGLRQVRLVLVERLLDVFTFDIKLVASFKKFRLGAAPNRGERCEKKSKQYEDSVVRELRTRKVEAVTRLSKEEVET